jgi:esterase
MKLFSKIHGDKGQDLIIIHGLFGMGDNWDTLAKQFSKYCKVHLIDLRNHGRSPHAKEFNYEVMCGDVLEYIEQHNIQKAILLGHSLGGKVAMKFAFTYPEKTEKLIVADIAPRKYSTDYHQNLLQKLSRLDLKDFTKRSELEAALSLFIEDAGIRLFLLKNLYRDEYKNFAWRFNLEVLLEKISNIQDASFVNGVCAIPTHFIRGGNSDYITSADELLINKHFSDFSMATIAGEAMGFCLM